MKQQYILTAAFPTRRPDPVEIQCDLEQTRAFHAAGNLDPIITEQRLIVLHLQFTAPTGPLLLTEPHPSSLKAAMKYLRQQIAATYQAVGEIKFRLQTHEPTCSQS